MSATVDPPRAAFGDQVPAPITLPADHGTPDRVFRGVVRVAGFGVLVLLFLIGLFLFLRGLPAFTKVGWRFFTTSGFQTLGKHPVFGVLASLVGTIEVAAVAMVVGAPIAIATALFLSEYAPQWSRRGLIAMVDLAAAIPSIIFGLWAVFELQPNVVGFSTWLSRHLAFIPFFKVVSPPLNASLFIAGLVVGIMIVPIVASICREVFSLAPPGEREAALALGASRWQMIRTVVLPFGRGGMIGAVMLGLGRALEETIAVSIILRRLVRRHRPHPPARRLHHLAAHRRQLRVGRQARPPGPAVVRVRPLRAHPGGQPGRLGHRQPVAQRCRGRPVTRPPTCSPHLRASSSRTRPRPPATLQPDAGPVPSASPTDPAPPDEPPPTPRRLPTPIRPSDFGPTDVLLLVAAPSPPSPWSGSSSTS